MYSSSISVLTPPGRPHWSLTLLSDAVQDFNGILETTSDAWQIIQKFTSPQCLNTMRPVDKIDKDGSHIHTSHLTIFEVLWDIREAVRPVMGSIPIWIPTNSESMLVKCEEDSLFHLLLKQDYVVLGIIWYLNRHADTQTWLFPY